jgi:hypothetical protein
MNEQVKKLQNKMTKWIVFVLVVSGILSLGGCYYDDEANLYPQIGGCDTSNVTYSGTISVIAIADRHHKVVLIPIIIPI